MRRIAVFAFAAASLIPGFADAAKDPDPVNAVLLCAASTALPVAVGSVVLSTGRGADEGVRLSSGLALIGGGAAVGPSIGQFYGRGGTNAWVTLGLRLVRSRVSGLLSHRGHCSPAVGRGHASSAAGSTRTTSSASATLGSAAAALLTSAGWSSSAEVMRVETRSRLTLARV